MKGTIGIIHDDESKQGLNHDFFAGILEGFRQRCNEMGYNIAFLNSHRDENNRQTYLEQIREGGYCGVLITCADNPDEIKELFANGIIVGTVDNDCENSINISSDNVMGMKALMEYILGKGHRNIAIITGDENLVCSIRLNEYVKALENHGIPINEDYIVKGRFRDIEKTAFLTEHLLKLDNPPTCIIFSDDFAAIGGINNIHARGLDIPRDISVAGYDGSVFMSVLEPSLTTVFQDTDKMGRVVAEKIIKGICNPDSIEYSTELVETVLQIGKSVGKVYEA